LKGVADMGDDLFGVTIVRLRRAFEEGDPAALSKATEAENVGLIQRSFRALGAGDLDAFAELLHDEIVLEILGPPSMPFERRLSGPRRVAEAVRSNFAQLEDHRSDIQSVVAQGTQWWSRGATADATGRRGSRSTSTGCRRSPSVTARSRHSANWSPSRRRCRHGTGEEVRWVLSGGSMF
jgi:ketosteroid isomerase-like protein